MQAGSGSLWRIRRTGGPAGDIPPRPATIPLYLLQIGVLAATVGLGLVAILAVVVGTLRRR